MKRPIDKALELSKDINLDDLLKQYNHVYGQLSALKHIVYSSLSLSDPESVVSTVSLQVKDYLTDKRNAVWLKDQRGRFVKTVLNGELLPSDQRMAVDEGSPHLPDGILAGRMKVWDSAPSGNPLVSGFTAPSFFPFKSDDRVTGFLIVDQVVSRERDVYQFVAHFAGMILNISLFHQKVERQREELEEITGMLMMQHEQMTSLHHVGVKIAVAPDPVSICGLIVDTLVEELGVKNASAFLLDDQHNELYCVAETGDLKPISTVKLRVDDYEPIKQSLASGRIVIRKDHSVTLDIGDNRLEDWTVYPLKCKDRMVGIVATEDGDMEIGDQAAILINHASIVMDTLMVLDKVSEERKQLADTLSSIGDGLITTDLQGHVTLMNMVAEELTGWRFQEAKGHFLNEVFCILDEQTRKPVEDTLQAALEGKLLSGSAYHFLLVSRDKTERPVVKSGTPIKDSQGRNIGTVIIFKDISDLLRLEQEFLKVQKIESLGVMAGGLAHDFNNLLNVILGNINLSQMNLGPDDSAAKSLQQAEQAVHKAKNLAQKFITFSSGGDPIKRTAVISRLLGDVADLALSGSNVKCEFNLPDDLWAVEIDHEQMRQVLYNILKNAEQAMAQGGVVRISAENCTLDDTHMEAGLQVPVGKYVLISVIDHGVGIEEEHLHKIFDPYFSTKDRGAEKGMGMGLAIAHSVIRKHGGDIRVESFPGKGTQMFIYLPVGKEQVPITRRPKPDESRQKKKRVLFMDDEKLLRDLATKTFEVLGYDASMAEDGVKAVTLYAEAIKENQPYGAVILDLTVPGGMGGQETLEKLREIDPEVQAIVSSGYASDPIMAAYRDFGFVEALPKPYNIEKLKSILETVMA